MKNLPFNTFPFLILMCTLFISCVNEKAEKAAIMETFTNYKNEIRNLGEPEKYITQNSFSYFDEILKVAKASIDWEAKDYIKESKEYFMAYKAVVFSRFAFVGNNLGGSDEKKNFRKFLMKNNCSGIWTDKIPQIEALSIYEFDFGFFGRSCTLKLKSDYIAVKENIFVGMKKVGRFSSEMLMKKEDGIWKIDVPSALSFYEMEEKGFLHTIGIGKNGNRIDIIEMIMERYPNTDEEKLRGF